MKPDLKTVMLSVVATGFLLPSGPTLAGDAPYGVDIEKYRKKQSGKPFPEVSLKQSIVLKPGDRTLSQKFIDDELRKCKSPAIGQGSSFIRWAKLYRIKPSIVLAFFKMDTDLGTTGTASITKNIANLRYVQPTGSIKYDDYEGFRKYPSWDVGIRDFCKILASEKYVMGGNHTIEQVATIRASESGRDVSEYNAALTKYLRKLFLEAR